MYTGSNRKVIMSAESDIEYSDNDCDDYDYYGGGVDDCDMETDDRSKNDPEYFVFTCLRVEEVEKLLNESIELLSNSIQITPSLAKVGKENPRTLILLRILFCFSYNCTSV